MTDLPVDVSGPAGSAVDWEDPDSLPLERVRELFVTLGKAFRAYQLYDENNPVYQRFVSSLREAFEGLWGEVDRLAVQVHEADIIWHREEVYRSESRSDSLAFLLYKDGIRDVTFLPGVEGEELERLLGVLQRARNLRPEGDDLLTILWEEDLQYFRYHYIDFLAEGVHLPAPSDDLAAAELRLVLEQETGAVPDSEVAAAGARPDRPPPAKVRSEDFNPTLYSLDAREMEQLRKEIGREMERDLRGDVIAALCDRLEEPERPERQSEILGVFRTLLPNFLGRGGIRSATEVLEELTSLQLREDVFDEVRRAESDTILDDLSAPESIQELIRALQDGAIRPSPRELSGFLSHLRAAALAPLVRAAELTEEKELRPILREAVRGIAERNREAVLSLLRSRDPLVAAGIARMAGRIQLTEAGPLLARLLEHGDARVRLAAVEASLDLRASTAASALVTALGDPERDVRVAAARTLGQLRYRPARDRLRELVTGKAVRGADLSEKIALFEAFGEVAGPEAIPLLERYLRGRGFLGRREPSEIRACAALALGRVNTPEARDVLEASVDETDPVIRSAVNRALRVED